MKIRIVLVLFLIFSIRCFSWDYTKLCLNCDYVIYFHNGDILTGTIVEFISSKTEGNGFKFQTELGVATIYEDQIRDVVIIEENYRHNHRIYLQPTAEPIQNNHFIGNFELFFLYGGVGFQKWLSFYAGRSIIPYVASKDQISTFNLKATIFRIMDDTSKYKLSLALGSNLAFVNHNNKFLHFYGVGSFLLSKTLLNASVFYKYGAEDFYLVRFGNNTFDLKYANGSFGVALGVDTRFSSFKDLHFIGELWNSDVASPTHTAVLLGFRICNRKFSADFGLSFFTQPFVAPFVSFVWTPF